MGRWRDLTGQRFGRLIAKDYQGGSFWRCLCDCGNIHYANSYDLLKGLTNRPGKKAVGTRSCGCLQRETLRESRRPDCHPEKQHVAKGLCGTCYQKKYAAETYLRRTGLTDLEGARKALLLTACAICGHGEGLHIDHDHKTGKIRKRLCGNCNRGLGVFQENPGLLREAALYLERHL